MIILTTLKASSFNISPYKKECLSGSIEMSNIPNISELDKNLDISEHDYQILINYPELKKIINDSNIHIPVTDNFIPQGIASIKEYYFISGYYDSKKNSKCYILNSLGKIVNSVELDTNSHVGAISYDKKRNLVWIPDNNGILNAYDLSEFFHKKKVNALYKFNYVSDGLIDYQNIQKKLIAYLCVDDDYIYLGNFFIDHECTIKKYQILDSDIGIELKYISSFNVPKRTQSIEFVEQNKKKYMILSQSYRRRNPSYLYVYEYNEGIKNYNGIELKKIKVPPMLEQISANNTSLFLLFESNATKYWNCPEKIESIVTINLLELLNMN